MHLLPVRPVRKDPQLADEFRPFPSLPPELRQEFWDMILDREKQDRKVVIFWYGVQPTKSLVSPLLFVNAESRSRALRRYPDALPVWRRHFRYRWGPKLEKGVPAGVAHISWSDDVVFRRLEMVSIQPDYNMRNDALRPWVPALNTWLYRNAERCYYMDRESQVRSVASCAKLHYQPASSDEAPQPCNVDQFFSEVTHFLPGTLWVGSTSAGRAN
ncbi:hypothetical protein PG997_010822 [Apiospora hydei]|uniref:2EXR domain-containing protein n=1 Tax=Apiospora hydei TaxID=1337664 RepID=A0ABR1VHA7_9PEZI